MSDTDKAIIIIATGIMLQVFLIIGERFLQRRKRKEELMAKDARVTISNEEMMYFDDLPPAVAVALAWSEPGDNPTWHHRMQAIVHAQMPTLARALDRLVATNSSKGETK